MKILSKVYMFLVFAMLYAPILVLIVFSFNESGSLSSFTGFSFKWYLELFRDTRALNALKNSLVLAASSAVISTVIGTLGALGLDRMRNRFCKSAILSFTNVPMMNPDIVTGVALMLLFVATIGFVGFGKFGFITMLLAHVTFSLPYVLLSVLPRFKQLDRSLCEAAMDLGCPPLRTFFKIEIPAVMSGIVSGLMLSFTLSLDDFVISYFVQSPDFETLPLYVYSQTAHDVKFSMYALCTLIIVAILVLLLSVNFLSTNKTTKRTKERKAQ